MKQFHLVSPASIRDWLHWQSPMKPHRGPPKLVHTQPYTANIHSAHRLAWCDSLRCRQSKLAVTVLSRYPFWQTGQGWQISQCPWLIRLPSRSCSNERTGHFNPHMHSNTQTLKHSNTEYWTDSGLCDDNAFVMRTQTLNRILVGPCGALCSNLFWLSWVYPLQKCGWLQRPLTLTQWLNEYGIGTVPAINPPHRQNLFGPFCHSSPLFFRSWFQFIIVAFHNLQWFMLHRFIIVHNSV